MKNLKRFASLLLALVMALSLTITAYAAEENPGSITINSAANVSVEGKTFNAYKLLDLKFVGEDDPDTEADERGYVYTVPAELKTFYAQQFHIPEGAGDFDGQVTAKIAALNSDGLFAFAASALAAAKTAGITPGTAKGEAGATSVTIANLPLGYYVVKDEGAAKPISALLLDSTDPKNLKIKADKPTIDKKIDGDTDTDSSTTGRVDANTAAVNDKVPYIVPSKVPDMTGYTKYYFMVTDTMSKGLTFNNDVAITVGDKALTKDTDYTVTAATADGITTIEIVFKNFIQYKENKGADITIAYSATVNEDAVIGVEGNPNDVKLTYSHNPNVDDGNDSDKPTPDSPVGETPKFEVRTYVTGIELIKVDQDGARLTGAEFQITGQKLNKVLVRKDVYTEAADGTYWKLKDGSYTTTDPAAEGMDQTKYESTTQKYTKTTSTEVVTTTETVNAKATVGSDGVLRFDGLSAGKYEIQELKAPAGYNLLKEPLKVTITCTAPASGSSNCTWTYAWGKDAASASNSIEIVNQAGTELPSTGGIGTTIFYIAGIVLMLAAAAILVMKKRAQK